MKASCRSSKRKGDSGAGRGSFRISATIFTPWFHGLSFCTAYALRRIRLIVEEKVDPKTAQGIVHPTDAGLTMNIYTYGFGRESTDSPSGFDSI
jgi:hypothetical protein